MGKDSGIEWTDRTWGVVTGCDRISRGCDFCYALSLSAELKEPSGTRTTETLRPADRAST
jgi:protein gp37